jgi:hypothetical protein
MAIGRDRANLMPPDSQNHNAETAEREWARKLALFKKALA